MLLPITRHIHRYKQTTSMETTHAASFRNACKNKSVLCNPGCRALADVEYEGALKSKTSYILHHKSRK